MKVVGGLYLLWMALQAARKVRRATGAPVSKVVDEGYARTWTRRVAMHLTNPKAIVVCVFAHAGVRMLLAR